MPYYNTNAADIQILPGTGGPGRPLVTRDPRAGTFERVTRHEVGETLVDILPSNVLDYARIGK